MRYLYGASPGIRRKPAGTGFYYVAPDGKRITNRERLRRIRLLVIPPAWTDVWICPDPHGHLQATGRDAKGRKQHRYHPLYRAWRDQLKYERMTAFGARPGMPREKVIAAVVRLLETTPIRVGNEEYARQNGSYGLTTLRDQHIKVAGEELFQYLDENGEPQPVTFDDVNQYVREAAGREFTAKDFRTWNGRVLAAIALGECEPHNSGAQAKRNVMAAVKQVAQRLGNRPATCRKYYLHPAILESYEAGQLLDRLKPARRIEARDGLTPLEHCVMRILALSSGQ